MRKKKIETQLNKKPRQKGKPKTSVVVQGLQITVVNPEFTFVITEVSQVDQFKFLLIKEDWSFHARFVQGRIYHIVEGFIDPPFSLEFLEDYRIKNALLEVLRKRC